MHMRRIPFFYVDLANAKIDFFLKKSNSLLLMKKVFFLKKISFRTSRSRISGTPCGSVFGRFCVFPWGDHASRKGVPPRQKVPYVLDRVSATD